MIFRDCISAPGHRFGSPSWSAYGVPSEPTLKVELNQCSAGQTRAGAAGSRAACADVTRHGASSTQAELDTVVAQRVAGQIGRASGRGRVCTYVEIAVVGGSLTNKNIHLS